MKKLISLISVIFLISFIACDSGFDTLEECPDKLLDMDNGGGNSGHIGDELFSININEYYCQFIIEYSVQYDKRMSKFPIVKNLKVTPVTTPGSNEPKAPIYILGSMVDQCRFNTSSGTLEAFCVFVNYSQQTGPCGIGTYSRYFCK